MGGITERDLGLSPLEIDENCMQGYTMVGDIDQTPILFNPNCGKYVILRGMYA
jgi:hypothetical protein